VIIEKIKENLVLKTTVVFLAAAMVPYILASIFFYQSSRKALYNEIVKGLRTETGLVRDAIDARTSLLRSNALAWADLEVMKDILTDDVDKRISDVFESLVKDYSLEGDIYALNLDGRIVASNDPAATGKTPRLKWLGRVLSGEIVELDTHTSEIDGSTVISFAVPVRSPFLGMKIIGALLLDYKVEGLKKIALGRDATLVAIFDRHGNIISATPNKSPFEQMKLDAAGGQEEGSLKVAGHIAAIARTRGYYDFRGFDWSVVVAVEEEKALYPIKKIERASIAAGVVGVIFILGLVTAFARRTARPLRELSETAIHIANTKDFSFSVKATTTDEVGRLAEAFNRMVVEVKRYIQRIREMEEDMRRADRLSALGELSAGMAHELKNPLGVIKSSAEILTKKLDANEAAGRLASAISEEAGRLEKLLEAFLKFARPGPPQMEPCNLNDAVDKVLTLLEPQITKEGITVEKRLDPALPSIYTDGNQFQQVLVNIIINAAQAMPGGGRLAITTGKAVEYSPMEPSKRNDVVVVAVSDTGVGISPELRDRIFNPFFTTKEKGTGLGLTIAHRIVEALGGWVKIEEARPSGTVFRIYLPMNDLRSGRHADQAVDAEGTGGSEGKVKA